MGQDDRWRSHCCDHPVKITLVYMTGRADPRLDWTMECLNDQLLHRRDEVELIVVDAHGRDAESIGYRPVPGVVLVETRPKSNIWQGPNRVTGSDWWATANARNTAICLATNDYIVFMDDRTRLGPRWAEMVAVGYRERRSVLAGSYEKHEDGKVTHDHRRGLNPHGKVNCGGGWLYGCCFAMPLEWALEVNGLEEGCDGLTGEDYIFGLMLENAGYRIDFEPGLYMIQDRSGGTEHGFKMTDKGVSPKDKSHAALDRFGKKKRTEFTPDLREIRRAGVFPMVDPQYEYRDWYDGQLIRELP